MTWWRSTVIERGLVSSTLEDASHKPFGSGVLELTRNGDDGPSTLVSRLDTEQLGLRGLYVVRHPIPCHTQRGNAVHRPARSVVDAAACGPR